MIDKKELKAVISDAFTEYQRAYTNTEDISGCIYPRDKFDSVSDYVAFKVTECLTRPAPVEAVAEAKASHDDEILKLNDIAVAKVRGLQDKLAAAHSQIAGLRRALEEVLANHSVPHAMRAKGKRSTTEICTRALSQDGVSGCEWKLDEMDGHYDTACGKAQYFSTDGVKENGYTHCPYCGKPISLPDGEGVE
jgi:hypothetical protein